LPEEKRKDAMSYHWRRTPE
ncbi:hypothetical protein CEXT_282401, partial [Caerostris extrusa]